MSTLDVIKLVGSSNSGYNSALNHVITKSVIIWSGVVVDLFRRAVVPGGTHPLADMFRQYGGPEGRGIRRHRRQLTAMSCKERQWAAFGGNER